jgi:hypothetical protein
MPESCNSTSTAPHTPVTGLIASEDFQGLVFAYSGASQNCPGNPLLATIPNLTGECGGASDTGQPVVCGPTIYSDPESPQDPSVTATLTFQYYVETEPNPGQPNVGPFSCSTWLIWQIQLRHSQPSTALARAPLPARHLRLTLPRPLLVARPRP